jgi:hypothetical protein
MNPTVKKALKTGGWSLGGVLGLLMVFVALLAFPGFMFAHQLAYRNLTVYADQDLRGGMEPILARVAAQVAASEINATWLEHDIYFGHDQEYFYLRLDVAKWESISLQVQFQSPVAIRIETGALTPTGAQTFTLHRPDGTSAAPLFHEIASFLAQRYSIPLSKEASPIVELVR